VKVRPFLPFFVKDSPVMARSAVVQPAVLVCQFGGLALTLPVARARHQRSLASAAR
jgi:hypothetical protein